ncbi:hypothetical protein L3X38_004575 [Prunus dulcis]|uniref:Uncharacterized protein n=1 Tax=Prunus dulcis TaxID=3755 RepID=A0AAD4ZP91_PRUDU|nr:hypothetical protein L3X38_004575 [Prunus dulcis]
MHIGRKFHFIRDAIQEGVVDLMQRSRSSCRYLHEGIAKGKVLLLRELLGVKSVNHLEGSVDQSIPNRVNRHKTQAPPPPRNQPQHHQQVHITTEGKSGSVEVLMGSHLDSDSEPNEKSISLQDIQGYNEVILEKEPCLFSADWIMKGGSL